MRPEKFQTDHFYQTRPLSMSGGVVSTWGVVVPEVVGTGGTGPGGYAVSGKGDGHFVDGGEGVWGR